MHCVLGGGAIEMELSKYLRDYSRTIPGKAQFLIGAMAKALEVIPRQLCDNAGFDATNILNKLRQKHAQGKAGIDDRKRSSRLISFYLQAKNGAESTSITKTSLTILRLACGSHP